MEREKNRKKFMENLNILKLLALILVVVGHSTNQYNGNWVFTSTQQSNLYKGISVYVNSIHMQIFVFISGAVYSYCKFKKKYYTSYVSLIKEKWTRLIVPYLFVGILFMLPIAISIGIEAYNNDYISSIKNLILGYSSGHLWFLMMLFMLFLIFYPIEIVVKKLSPPIGLLLMFIIQIVSRYCTTMFFINISLNYMLFFYLGYIVYLNLDNLSCIFSKIYNKRYIVVGVIFMIISMLISLKSHLPYVKIITYVMNIVVDNLIALAGIVQMYIIVRIIKDSKYFYKCEGFINNINKYNFNIYLLHEPIIFIVLSNILNSSPNIVVISCFTMSIFVSIIISKLYYLLIKNIQRTRKDKKRQSNVV